MNENENSSLITINTADLAAAGWIAERDRLVGLAQEVAAIEDNDGFSVATALVADLSRHRKVLDGQRRDLTRRIDDIKKGIMDQERELAAGLDAEYNRLRSLAGDYATRLERERHAAEAARRQAEAEAAMRAEAEAAAQAEEAARAQAMFGADAVVAPPAPPSEPLPVVPEKTVAMGGRKQVVVYDFEITDPTILDRKFLSPDEKKIRAFVQFAKSQGIEPGAINEPGLKVTKSISIR